MVVLLYLASRQCTLYLHGQPVRTYIDVTHEIRVHMLYVSQCSACRRVHGHESFHSILLFITFRFPLFHSLGYTLFLMISD